MGPSPKPKPPLPGGEHVQFIDTGPQAVSPNATRVNLIPVGDGGPGPLLPRLTHRKKRKSLLPSRDEIAKLPRWAELAFAARCARRVLPIYPSTRWAEEHYHELQRATARKEDIASRAAEDTDVVYDDAVYDAVYAAGRDGATSYTSVHAASRDEASVAAAAAATATDAFVAAQQACNAILAISTDPLELMFIRRDFERVAKLARRHGWTDDTPVPPDVFGPLWPPGREPRWAREKREPRG